METKKIVIILHHVGPYHATRINDLSSRVKDVIVVELANSVYERNWERADTEGFELITLADDIYENIPPKKLVTLIEDVLEKVKPKCVVTCGYSHSAMRAAARWAKKQSKTGTVLLSESQYIDHKRNPLKEYLKSRWIKRFFDAAFVGGSSAAFYLQNMGFPQERIWRGYNVVDNPFFEEKSDAIRVDPHELQQKLELPPLFFLYVGRFSEEKNLVRLLRAYKRYLSEAGSQAWGLVMVGSGPQEKELRGEAVSLGLKDICWPGFVQIDDLPKYYALASGFILPSTREPWGLVVNEAMASGLPVLVSVNCGCALDLVVPGINGRLFDPYSDLDIAGAMKWLSSRGIALQAMGNSSKSIIALYSPHHWASALGDCISTLI